MRWRPLPHSCCSTLAQCWSCGWPPIWLDKLTDLPILRQANKLLGLVAGVVLALLRVWLFCAVVQLLLPCADTLGLGIVSHIDPANTFLFKFFYENNFFSLFFA